MAIWLLIESPPPPEIAVQILDLQNGHLLTLSPGTAQRVQVLYGRIWLTENGRSEDVFAASGEVIDLSPRGRVLIEGLGFARIAVVAPAPRGAAPSWRAVSHRVRSFARRVLAALAGQGAARPVA
jgi:hypothetical protein